MDTAVGFVNVDFYDCNGKRLGLKRLQFDYSDDDDDVCEEIDIPKKTTEVCVSFAIDVDDEKIPIDDPLPSGHARIVFVNAEGKNLKCERLDSFECANEEREYFDVPKKTVFLKIYCTLYQVE